MMSASAFSRLSLLFVLAAAGGTATPARAFLDFLKKTPVHKAPQAGELQAQEAAAQDLLRQAQATGKTGFYDDILKRYPLTNTAAEAAYAKAMMVRQNGKLKDAFNAFQLLVDNYRQSTRFADAIQQQYEIAEEAKGGKKQRTMIMVPMKLGPNETIDLYKKVITNAPYGKYAPLAQFSIAEIHQDQGEKNEAIAAYQKVVDDYPSTKEASEAQFRIGAISNIAARSTADSSNLGASRDALRTYVTTNPGGERAGEAQQMLKQIDADEAKRSLAVGRFYEKSGKPKAAAIYYNEALKFGDPDVSAEARERLAAVSAAAPAEVAKAKTSSASNDYTAPAASDLRRRSDYVGPPSPELARLAAKPKMRADGGTFAPAPAEPKLPSGAGNATPPDGSLLPPVGGDKPALLPVPVPPSTTSPLPAPGDAGAAPGIPPQPVPPPPPAEKK